MFFRWDSTRALGSSRNNAWWTWHPIAANIVLRNAICCQSKIANRRGRYVIALKFSVKRSTAILAAAGNTCGSFVQAWTGSAVLAHVPRFLKAKNSQLPPLVHQPAKNGTQTRVMSCVAMLRSSVAIFETGPYMVILHPANWRWFKNLRSFKKSSTVSWNASWWLTLSSINASWLVHGSKQ